MESGGVGAGRVESGDGAVRVESGGVGAGGIGGAGSLAAAGAGVCPGGAGVVDAGGGAGAGSCVDCSCAFRGRPGAGGTGVVPSASRRSRSFVNASMFMRRNSTRRFIARPSAVLFDPMGWVSP